MTADFAIVVVSSKLENRLRLSEILMKFAVNPICVSSLKDCHQSALDQEVGLIFCDPSLVDGTYTDLLADFRRRQRKPRVVVTSPSGDWEEFKEAMRRGAFDIIVSPCRANEVEWMLIQAKRDERNRKKFEGNVVDVTDTGHDFASTAQHRADSVPAPPNAMAGTIKDKI